FAPTLLILRVSQQLSPTYGAAVAGALAVGLYTLHNVVYAGCSFPVGVLSERFGKRPLLLLGYLLFGVIALGFALAPANAVGLVVLSILFVVAGLYIALVDAMEGALA